MSRTKFFRKSFDGSVQQNSLQNNIEDAIGTLLKNPLLDGRLIENYKLISGDNSIEHKLARVPRGRIVTANSNASAIYDVSKDDKFLVLNAAADITVSLWIY